MRRETGARIEGWLVALLTFAVLCFGATPYWARAVLCAGSAVLFVAWWRKAGASRLPAAFEPGSPAGGIELAGVRLRRSGLGIPTALLLGVVLLQFVSLPSGLRSMVAPARSALEGRPADVLSGAAAAMPRWGPISVDRDAGIDSLLLLLAYAALFVLVYNLVDGIDRVLRICRMLAVLGIGVAAVGLVQDLSGTEQIFWFKELRYGGAPYGPFVNHNHFAGFMELTIPITFGLLLRRLARHTVARPSPSPGEPSGPGSLARRALGAAAAGPTGERAGQAVLWLLGLSVMLAALLLSLSRGGLLSLAGASALVLVSLAVGGKLGRWEAAAMGVAAVGGLLLFLWIGPQEALEHFRHAESLQNEPSLMLRPRVWGGTVDMFLGSPVLGVGLGSFPVAFLHYYPAGTERLWLQAHNDYVQLLAEVGLVGAAVAAFALLRLLVWLLGPLLRGPDVRERYLYRGLVTAILALLIHSLVDFNLQIPANAALFVVLCAVALAQRNTLRRSET